MNAYKSTYRWLRFLILALTLNQGFSPIAYGATVTATKVNVYNFNTGFLPLWAYWNYNWNVTFTLDPTDVNDPIAVNAFHVTWTTIANYNKYKAGPGAETPGVAPAGAVGIYTAAPLGFGSPIIFTMQSVNFPAAPAMEPAQTFTLGNYVPATKTFTAVLLKAGSVTVASLPVLPGNSTTGVGSTAVAYGPGTFSPNVIIDLFQNTSTNPFLGSGTSLSDGSVFISLSSPLTSGLLAIGQRNTSSSGTIIGTTNITGSGSGSGSSGDVPLPSWALFVLAIALLGIGHRYQSRRT